MKGVLTGRGRLATSAVTLLVGALLYLARKTEPAVLAWLDHVGLERVATVLRAARAIVRAHIHLPAWFLGSASDAAWAFALGVILADASPALVTCGFAVALGHEIGQGLGVFAGTFDPFDLAVLAASFVLALALFRKNHRHDQEDLLADRRPSALRRAGAR